MNHFAGLVIVSAVVLLTACGGGEKKRPASRPAAESGVGASSPGWPDVSTASSSGTPAPAVAASAADPVKGAKLFAGTCAACHGPLGKGDGPGAANLDPKPRDFSDKVYMATLKDAEIQNTIKYGGAMKAMPQMPSHPWFSDPDLASLVAHVRSLSAAKGEK